jgi:glucans biosynthesis protein
VIVFLGASYFRAVGAGQHYGLSARGLGVDTSGGPNGEEFPAFEAYWIERPAGNAQALTVYALLNGPRVTGAYRFVIRPGSATEVEVRSRLFLRAPATLGIAPLTSMYFGGENQPAAGRLPPRGARLRRPADRDRQRRMAVAAAHQSPAAVHDQLLDAGRARLRPDAA